MEISVGNEQKQSDEEQNSKNNSQHGREEAP